VWQFSLFPYTCVWFECHILVFLNTYLRHRPALNWILIRLNLLYCLFLKMHWSIALYICFHLPGGSMKIGVLTKMLKLSCFIRLTDTRPADHKIILVFNNIPTRCDLFSLLHFCRQLYMFLVLTPIIRGSYSCNYSFWYWLTGSTTIRCRCWVGTQQRERLVVDPVNRYQKPYLHLYELLMMGVNTRNM